jgi:hypothetical protein
MKLKARFVHRDKSSLFVFEVFPYFIMKGVNGLETLKKNFHFRTVVLLMIGISFAVGFGYYKNAVAKEQITASIAVNSEGTATTKDIIFDIADQGRPKKWLQPNQILIASYLIKNEGMNPLTIKVEAVNFAKDVILEVGSSDLQRPSSTYTGTVNPGKVLRVKVKISLADNHFSQTKQLLGVLQIINEQNGVSIGNTPVYAIDSTTLTERQTMGNAPEKLVDPHVSHESHEKK